MSTTIPESKINQLLQYLRISAFEEFTEGTDEDWEQATNFAVTVGSKIMELLDLDVIVQKQ